MTHILGISAYYHDSAACLVTNGQIVAAAQEERFTRKKHDPGFPSRAVEYCLKAGGVTLKDVKYIVFYDKPLVKFERLIWMSGHQHTHQADGPIQHRRSCITLHVEQ